MPWPATVPSMASATKAALLVFALLGMAGATQAANMYCCQDPNSGRRVCSDNLPEQCRGRPYRILDGGGNLIKEVEAPLTPEQKAERLAEEKKRRQEEAAIREQRRKDQALLDTYGSLQDIEVARTRSEGLAKEAIRQTEEKISLIRQQRKKWENEAEFYKKGNMPPEVEKGLREADYELRAYTTLLESKTKELDLIRAKYEEDRRRYLDITSGRRYAPPVVPQQPPAPPAPKQ